MASGTLDADNLREKRRWGEGNKVYTRKFHRKGVKTTPAAAAPPADAVPTTTADAEAVTTTVAAAAISPKPTGSDVPRQSPQTLATEDANSEHPQQISSRIEVVSDDNDSSSHNRQPDDAAAAAATNGNEEPLGNGFVKPVVCRVDDRVKINLKAAVSSKNEIRELRQKLLSELEQVRSLVQKLESKEAELTAHSAAVIGEEAGNVHSLQHGREIEQVRTYSHSQHSGNDVIDRRALVRVNSEVGSGGNHQDLRPLRHLSVSVVDNSHGVGEFLEKEKRTPKANQYYRNSDFLLGKDRLPPESNKKAKANGGKKHGRDVDHGFGFDRYRNHVFKNCGNLLQRLMKHKHGWVFNEPVNAKLLGLHDYHDIIKQPMDLGTVKSRLAQNFYKSPREFAEDVRLTFRNAMTYNPKGQDVHVMAEQLSNVFEERWAVIESEYHLDWRYGMIYDSGLQTPTSRKTPSFTHVPPMRTLDRSESMPVPFDSRQRPSHFVPVARTPVPKKPKAKDPNKRDMTYEEKQKLSTNLQNLPSEKLDNIVQIIKKRNSSLCQHDDEIEVDIDSVDAETLWELDRFVTNYKKSLSKHKRKAELALQARVEAGQALPTVNPAPVVPQAAKETKADEKSLANTSPVQGERQGDNVSRSSSSSSSSSDSGSSSSDSDSDSSSDDGSAAGHSPRS